LGGLLDTVLAQPTAVGTLRRALETGRVHHAWLFDGPPGVGKELAAFGLAQALVCERRGTKGHPATAACGVCRACERAVLRKGERRPAHPDITVLERGLYEASTIGRRTPETQDLSIDQVRTLVLARSAFAPHEGRAKVFIIRRAEEMSTSAANALLKTLEEPIASTYFVLLTEAPGAMLPTVLSRTQRVRFAPLPDAVLLALLEARGVAKEQAESALTLAAGSLELALAACDPEESAQRDAFVAAAERALVAPDLGPALELAELAKKGKAGLDRLLLALAARLAQSGRTGSDAEARTASARYALALQAVRDLDRNASPQLVVEAMLVRMRTL
jgi:DNA polymerase-3 subunit delta'